MSVYDRDSGNNMHATAYISKPLLQYFSKILKCTNQTSASLQTYHSFIHSYIQLIYTSKNLHKLIYIIIFYVNNINMNYSL